MATTVNRTSALGRLVRAEREKQDLTRRVLSERSGITEATIARIELYGSEPTLSTVLALARALGTNASALLDVVAANPAEAVG